MSLMVGGRRRSGATPPAKQEMVSDVSEKVTPRQLSSPEPAVEETFSSTVGTGRAAERERERESECVCGWVRERVMVNQRIRDDSMSYYLSQSHSQFQQRSLV